MISTCPKCENLVSIPAGVESTVGVRCPLCGAEYPLGEALALAPPELVPIAAASAETTEEEVERESTTTDSSAISAAIGEDVETPLESTAENHAADEGNEAARVAPRLTASAASAQWKRRKPKSALQMLVEVILGGVAGCVVAYYGLAFWFGPHFNKVGLPRLPLPFIERITAPKPEKNDSTMMPRPGKILSAPDLPDRNSPWKS